MAETPTRLTAGIGPGQMLGHLRGGWLLAARLLWLILAGGALLLFALALPVGYRLLATPCAEAACLTDQLSPEGVAALAAAGLTPQHYALYNVALAVGLVAVTSGAAVLIFLRRSDEPVALYVSLTLVLLGVFVNSYSDAVGTLGDLPLLAADLYHALMWVLFPILFYIFPDGRFVPRWTILPALAWGYIQSAYFIVSFGLLPVAFNPGNWPESLSSLFFVALFITCVYAQFYRYRNLSDPTARQQTKWVVFGLILAVVVIVVAGVVPEAIDSSLLLEGSLSDMAIDLIAAVALALIPLAFGVAILRYRLWDIDVLIRRTLSYTLLTLGLAAAYFLSVVILQTVFSLFTGQQASALVTVLSTLTIAALFTPLRARIQAFIDRRFYRRKYDAARTLAAFSASARDEVDLDTLNARLMRVVEDTMQPAHIDLWVRPAGAPPEAQPPAHLPHRSGAGTASAVGGAE